MTKAAKTCPTCKGHGIISLKASHWWAGNWSLCPTCEGRKVLKCEETA